MPSRTLRIKMTQEDRDALISLRDRLEHTLPSGQCSLGQATRIAIVQGRSALKQRTSLALEPHGSLDAYVSVIGAFWLWDEVDSEAERLNVTRARVIRELIRLGMDA